MVHVPGVAACSNGIETTIIDKGCKCGGRFYSRFPDGFEIDASGLDRKYLDLYHAEGAGRIDSLERLGSKINRITQATVWGIYPDRTIAYVKTGKTNKFRFEKLIPAKGAIERSVAGIGACQGRTCSETITAITALKMQPADRTNGKLHVSGPAPSGSNRGIHSGGLKPQRSCAQSSKASPYFLGIQETTAAYLIVTGKACAGQYL